MSNVLTLARPYARAAFALARDHGRLPQWSALLGFAATVAGDERVRALLDHPGLGDDDRLALLLTPGESDPNFRQFLIVLASNRRLALLPEIAALYEQARAEQEQIVKVTLTSAAPVANEEVAKIADSLRRRFGREIALTQAVDPDLIGGAVIDAGFIVIDGSVRGKLRRLEATLAQ